MTAAREQRQYQFEMSAYIHDMLAERAALKQQVLDLTLELEIARQMLRRAEVDG
jgi:hypothetical protein